MPISGREMAKLFEEKGYKAEPRNRGSHMKFTKKGNPPVIIPDHKELKRGTESALLKILKNSM